MLGELNLLYYLKSNLCSVPLGWIIILLEGISLLMTHLRGSFRKQYIFNIGLSPRIFEISVSNGWKAPK